MCGRFTLTINGDQVAQVLELGSVPVEMEPRYNIAPTQSVAVVTDGDDRDIQMFRWGLVPSWADDETIGNRLINARAETVAEKPSFRAAFTKRRCLVLADGFYEWERIDGKKKSQPHYFSLENGDPFAFAGLWEIWKPTKDSDPLYSCTLITTTANERVAPVHDRNPVILTGDRLWAWMDPKATPAQLHDLLRPLPANRMTSYEVSTMVNKPSNDVPDLIEPLGA